MLTIDYCISKNYGLRMEELLVSALLLDAIPAGKHQGLLQQRTRAIPEILDHFRDEVPKRYWRQFQLREDVHGIVQLVEDSK